MQDEGHAKANPVSLPKLLFTYDEERVEHIITDEKLMQLTSGGDDISLQISIGALGVAVGVFQNFVSVAGAIQDALPVSVWDAGGAGIFLIAATTFIGAGLYWRKTSTTIGTMVDEIRNRKRGTITDRPYVAGEPFSGDPNIPTETSSTTG